MRDQFFRTVIDERQRAWICRSVGWTRMSTQPSGLGHLVRCDCDHEVRLLVVSAEWIELSDSELLDAIHMSEGADQPASDTRKE